MSKLRSKITSKGLVSVPIEVRRTLGVGPGSILEWDEKDGQIIVRRAGTFSSEDIHQALFPEGAPEPKTLAELKDGIRRRV
jgi:AbrB family looped-hinge helix DNA binding protein